MSVPINNFEYRLTRIMALLDRPWKLVIAFDIFILVLSVATMLLTGSVSIPILAIILILSSLIAYIIARILFTYNKINRETLAELKRIARELAQRNADLEAFAMTVAHDLKTPINNIYGYTYLLRDEESIAEAHLLEAAEQIQSSAEKMSMIIDDLLLLAKIGSQEVEIKPIEMGRVVENSLNRLGPMITESRAQIILPETWPAAQGHAGWVEEIWVNYISNALKYGGQPPKIQLGGTIENGFARFWVKDNGGGIPLAEREVLFKEFIRLDRTRSDSHGLGLAIVRRIAAKLHGEVGMDSLPGEGSTFYFTLPAD